MSDDTPYRSDPSQVERLLEEIESLRAQLEELRRGPPLLPHTSLLDERCQKCGLQNSVTKRGPSQVYEAAYAPSWWRRLFGARAHPDRMRRDCPYCKATYYERTKDQESP